jgi:hypothetical protein
VRRPQARSRRGRRLRRAALDQDFDLLLLPLPFPLSRRFSLSLDNLLSHSFSLKGDLLSALDQTMRTASTRSWREQRQTASKWMIGHHRVREHPINRTPPNTRNSAVEPAHGLVPHMADKQIHPLMRRIQNERIVPGPPQILAITLVCTCGPNFPLSRLESRFMCPASGSRRVTVVFQPPANTQVGNSDGYNYLLVVAVIARDLA